MKRESILFVLGLGLGCSDVLAQEVTLGMPGGGQYIGTVTNGVPDGRGYFKDADGMQYEGEVHMGRREGMAEGLFRNGDRYKGQWKDGKPDGIGTMIYMVGGAFEGRWREGDPDGRGIMTFAGSARRAEVGFLNGKRIGTAPPPAPDQDAGKKTYALRAANLPTGSHLAHKVSTSAFPMNLGWGDLTPAQQRMIRDRYPALDEADEPPYPLKGPQELYARLAELAGKYDVNEEVIMYVLVGADGKVASVTSIGIEDPDARRLAGLITGLLKYKPARCGGQACQMMVPFKVKLGVTY